MKVTCNCQYEIDISTAFKKKLIEKFSGTVSTGIFYVRCEKCGIHKRVTKQKIINAIGENTFQEAWLNGFFED